MSDCPLDIFKMSFYTTFYTTLDRWKMNRNILTSTSYIFNPVSSIM